MLGRPTDYNDRIADKICTLVSISEKGLEHICEENPDLPVPSTIALWRIKYPAFSEKYRTAKSFQAELYAESTDRIALELKDYFYTDPISGAIRIDSGVVAAAKTLIDSRKWHASKLAPKIYGDLAKQAEDTKDSLIEQLINKIK